MAGHIDPKTEYAHITGYWRLEIDGFQLSANEVSGLTEELEVCTYRAGDRVDGYTSKRAGLPKVGQLTVKKGIFTSDNYMEELFHKWRDDRSYNSDEGERVDILVTLVDENEADVLQWNCVACWPSKYEGPTLKGDESAIAFETMTFEVEEVHSLFM